MTKGKCSCNKIFRVVFLFLSFFAVWYMEIGKYSYLYETTKISITKFIFCYVRQARVVIFSDHLETFQAICANLCPSFRIWWFGPWGWPLQLDVKLVKLVLSNFQIQYSICYNFCRFVPKCQPSNPNDSRVMAISVPPYYTLFCAK